MVLWQHRGALVCVLGREKPSTHTLQQRQEPLPPRVIKYDMPRILVQDDLCLWIFKLRYSMVVVPHQGGALPADINRTKVALK